MLSRYSLPVINMAWFSSMRIASRAGCAGQDVRVLRRPSERQCGSVRRRFSAAADLAAHEARAQRKAVRLAQHQYRVAVVDDVVDGHVEDIVLPAAVAGGARTQALGPDHEID